MCGICSILRNVHKGDFKQVANVFEESRLQRRGPDASSEKTVQISPTVQGHFYGCTLHFQGQFTPQPICDSGRNLLLWNGEVFAGLPVETTENDGQVVMSRLSHCTTHEALLSAMLLIQGPWAFIYWQASSSTLWFGRDVLGRRSLLYHLDDDQLVLSSVSVTSVSGWSEVPAAGIYYVEVPSDGVPLRGRPIHCYRWSELCDGVTASSRPSEADGAADRTAFTRSPRVVPSAECRPIGAGCLRAWAGGVDIAPTPLGLLSPLAPFNCAVPTEADSERCAPDDLPAAFARCGEACRQLLALVTGRQVRLSERLEAVLGAAVRRRVMLQAAVCGRCLRRDADGRVAESVTGSVTGSVSGLSNTPTALGERTEQHPSSHHAAELVANSSFLATETLNLTRRHHREQTAGRTFVENGSPGGRHDDVSCRPGEHHQRAQTCGHARVAVLFSGGIDSLVIAALAHRYVPADESIDLLNVAFEMKAKGTNNKRNHTKEQEGGSRFDVPDRLTGRRGLQQLAPDRTWNFVEINVTLEELQEYRRDDVCELVRPHKTILDDSIGCAIWCAARGRGVIGRDQAPYCSTARVVLVGMGADEQLAGYSRHRTRFMREGWGGLADELKMEMERIAARNLGRDDRVIADHGREARFPFLDEDVVSFLNSLPVNDKADLRLGRGAGEKSLLRLVAHRLHLHEGAALPKRAIQFGSRIAGLERRRENAADVCDRLADVTVR